MTTAEEVAVPTASDTPGARSARLPVPLACPRCARSLAQDAGTALRCGHCRMDFPQLDGVPALYPEPAAALGAWQARLHGELRRLQHEARRCEAALEGSESGGPRHRRLTHLRDAQRLYHDELRTLCAPLVEGRPAAGLETYRALGTAPLLDEGLTTYATNVHRDWCWGDAENTASVTLIDEALGGAARPRRMLVIGSGAGRLAHDLHALWGCETTVTLDFNPMLVLLAARMARGESCELHEFPIAPRSIEHHAVARTLKAPAPAAPGFWPVLGDALHPPFETGYFDLVLTPWLVDVLPNAPGDLAAVVNQQLKTGGRWLSFGSMNFVHPDPERCIDLEEFEEIVEQTGFEAPVTLEREMPYLCSPASRHGRRETVVTLAATKATDAPRRIPERPIPDWLESGRRPVPRLPDFELRTLSTRVQLFILGLVDGKRSIRDMAQAMEAQRLMSREEAEPEIRTFLARIHEESQRARYR